VPHWERGVFLFVGENQKVKRIHSKRWIKEGKKKHREKETEKYTSKGITGHLKKYEAVCHF